MAVRSATPADIATVGKIAYRAFQYSPWFPFEHPHNADFPKDAEQAYCREYQQSLTNGKQLFTVFEIERESGKGCSDDSPTVVVGLAVWNLADGSPLVKDDSQSGKSAGTEDKPQDRTSDPYRAKLLSAACDKAREKYFRGEMELDNMAVDPDHWRHGYGSRLCEHGMEIAKNEKTSIGILAAGSGVGLYKALGFCDLEKVVVKDDRKGEDASTDFTVFKWPHDSKL